MNTATVNTANRDLIKPDGLSEAGQKAYAIIVAYLKANNLTCTELRVFYAPAEWIERGHEYGTKAQLIVMYDGATSLKRVFSMDACYAMARPGVDCYALYEGMQAKLNEAGMFFEECTGWYAAIYTD
jgi:hypothetical protein